MKINDETTQIICPENLSKSTKPIKKKHHFFETYISDHSIFNSSIKLIFVCNASLSNYINYIPIIDITAHIRSKISSKKGMSVNDSIDNT